MSDGLERVVLPVTPFQQNCSILWSGSSKQGVIIDPGGDLERIRNVLESKSICLEKILLTHGHLDHAAAAGMLSNEYDIPIEGPHIGDKFWLDAIPEQSIRYGFPQTECFEPNRWLENGDKVTFSDQSMKVIHCPGHTPGHVVFYHETGLAFVGDVLFMGSVGRTDLPKGSFKDLTNSIRERLWPLGNGVRFVPGHGPESTFGYERQTNPFVADFVFEED